MNGSDLILNIDNCNYFDLELVPDFDLDFTKGSLNNLLITDDLLFYFDFTVYQSVNNVYSLTNPQILPITGITGSAGTMSLVNDSLINIPVLSTSGGTFACSYIPERYKEGFTLNFLINKGADTTQNMFFEMGTSLVNGINFSYSGDYLSFTETLNKRDCQWNKVVQTITSGQSVVMHESPWINLCITYKRDEDLEYCREIQNWVPIPKIIEVFGYFSGNTGCTGNNNEFLTGATGDSENSNMGYPNNHFLTGNTDYNWYNYYTGNTYNPWEYEKHFWNSGWTGYTGYTGYPHHHWNSGWTGYTNNSWYSGHTGFTHHSFVPSGYTCESPIPSTQIGMLKFFINGRPVYEVRIEEPVLSYADTGFTIATNFNGEIGMAMMYKRPLSIPEIINNYYAISNIYNIKETFGGPKIVVSYDLTDI